MSSPIEEARLKFIETNLFEFMIYLIKNYSEVSGYFWDAEEDQVELSCLDQSIQRNLEIISTAKEISKTGNANKLEGFSSSEITQISWILAINTEATLLNLRNTIQESLFLSEEQKQEFMEAAILSFEGINSKSKTGRVFPRSGRAYTNMSRLGIAPLELLGKPQNHQILNKVAFERERPVLDLESHPLGIYKSNTDLNYIIPVARYGKDSGSGYLGKGNADIQNSTWYYWEPDSSYCLSCKSLAITLSKSGFLQEYPQELPEVVEKYLLSTEGRISKPASKLLLRRIMNAKTSDSAQLFGGKDDWMDVYCGALANHLGLEVVIFAREGLTTEILDVRSRQNSLGSIIRCS